MTKNIGSKQICSRKDCLVCIHEDSKGNCKAESITYQINCNRSPCNLNFDPKSPLEIQDSLNDPPYLYRGESSRTSYIRGSQHLRDYRGKRDKSVLWKHTKDKHGGVIGDERGSQDFRMIQLEKWPKPLDRLTAEGVLIRELEELHDEDKAVCLNSKSDFRQSHQVTLAFSSGSNLD